MVQQPKLKLFCFNNWPDDDSLSRNMSPL